MSRKARRASTPEQALGVALDAARKSAEAVPEAEPVAPSDEPARVTEAVRFRSVGPYFDSPRLFQVCAGVAVPEALVLAQNLLAAMRGRFSDAVGGEPIRGDEAYAYELLTEMVYALYAATGACE